MTRTIRNAAASATIIAASVVGVALAGAGTASAAVEPSKGGPIYYESFGISFDPDAVSCADRAAANRARGDIILLDCKTIGFGFDSNKNLIGINVSLGS
ncbi:hypothetical protein GCM10007304_14670 [Rhodococcoides trifolii]|uniref:Secreted protein n=1 Tax=Rhodococcoides trifolii TaxID=908250 RepID=A0A917CY31_9NOCA|nr:hypothetical protein [Rhodococcus trifolii]GGG01737.1 hypothetical protein GCM10007304_14670 [Rhodococcus trifolii]